MRKGHQKLCQSEVTTVVLSIFSSSIGIHFALTGCLVKNVSLHFYEFKLELKFQIQTGIPFAMDPVSATERKNNKNKVLAILQF